MDKLREDLRSADPQTREKAERELDELSKKAQDPATRKAAEQMKQEQEANNEPRAKQGDKSNEKSGTQKDSGKQGEKDGPEGTQGAPKGQGTKPSENQTDPKKGNDGKDAGKPEGNSKQTPGQPGSKPAGSENPTEPTKGDPQQSEANNNQRSSTGKPTGNAPPKNNGELVEGKANRPDVPQTPAEKLAAEAGKHKAGDLVLDDLKKKVTDDILKKANMTREEYEKFLKAYEAMLKSKQPAGGKPDDVIAPQKGWTTEPNRGVHKVDTGVKADSNALRTGSALPPPEFRDAYIEFSKRLSDMEQKREKK